MLSGIEIFSTFLILIILFPHIADCKKSTATEKVLPEDYDRLVPPNKAVKELSSDPVNVEIKLSVLNVRAVKETDLTFTMDLFYHQHWTDKRFVNRTEDRVVLDRDWNDRIWVPDTFFKQAISGEVSDIVFPALYYIINRDGEVFMGARISVTFICKMQFQRYPHDVQRCNFDIQSLSNTKDVVHLQWKGVTIVDHITTIQYDVTSGELSDCSRTYDIGNFSCIRAGIVLTRRIGHFLIKKYIPSSLVVLMSFVGFWIPTDSYPARIAIVVTSLLGLITQEIQTSGEINASYVVALNIWYIGCITFVFLALIEFAFAMLHFHKIAQNSTQSLYQRMNTMTTTRLSAQMNPDGSMCVIPCNQQDNPVKMNGLSVTTRRSEELNPNWAKILVQKLLSSQSRNQNRVDIVSRKIFPVSYTLFIIMYIFYIKFF